MIDFAGFSSGYLAQQEQDERKRRELAQAFGEFQRRNPTATAAQFQQFIDSMSGGRNYLAGGMPSGEALRAVIDQADQERSRQEIERNRKRFRENIETQNQISGLVDGILLSSDDPGEGGYSAENYAEMVNQLKDRMNVQDFSEIGFDPTNMFTPDRRNMAIANRIQQYLPALESLIENAGGRNLTESDLAAFNLPKGIVQPMLRRAARMETERRERNARELRGEMYREAMMAVQQGRGADVYETLSVVFGENQIPARDSRFMQGLQAQVDEETNKMRNQVEREKKSLGNAAREKLLNDPDVKAAILQNDDQEVMEAMLVSLNDVLTDQDFVSLFGTSKENIAADPALYLGSYVKRIRSGLGFKQRNLAADAYRKNQDRAFKNVQAYVEENKKKVDQYFGSAGKMTDLAGPAKGVAGIVARSLADTYDMNSRVLGAMATVFAGLPENYLKNNPDPEQLKQLVIDDRGFQDAVRLGGTTAEAKAAISSAVFSNEPPLIGFDAFMTNENKAIDASMQEANKDLKDIVNSHKDNPDRLDQKLDGFEASVQRGLALAVQRINKLKSQQLTAYEGFGWVNQNEDGEYSDEAMNKLVDTMKSSVQEILKQVAAQKAANNLARNNAQQTSTTTTSTATIPPGIKAQPGVLDWERAEKRDDITQVKNQAVIASTPIDKFINYLFGASRPEILNIKQADMVKDFVSNPNVLAFIVNDDEALQAFSRDSDSGNINSTVNYLMTTKNPAVVNWFKTEGRDYAKLLDRRIPDTQ